MSARPFQFERGGIHLPELALWLDPKTRRSGPERAFVSHAHSDHTGRHREVILSGPTARLMQARLGGKRVEHILPFGEARGFTGSGAPFHITLLPAGHILGSAMSWLEWDGRSLLYTGDFKLRRGLSAELCEPRHAEILIMETTFGLPHYRFPPTAVVVQDVIEFCREALADGVTPVLLGYSLGKSQELLCALADAALPIMLHDTVAKLTGIYEQLGREFPAYEPFDESVRGRVLVCPPGIAEVTRWRALGQARVAILTGWAVDAGCRYRYQVDAAFPLSDHADYPDLMEFVRQVAPEQVYTLHGFAADFAAALRDQGYDAQALGVDEQLTLPLRLSSPGS